MSLHDIHVLDLSAPLTGTAQAVLREISARLETLVATGEAASIDLRSLPFSESDRAWLRQKLGEGEVKVSLDAGGESRIVETTFPGVWWVEHRDEAGARISEFIEICRVPEILVAHPDDLRSGARNLKRCIDDLD